MVFSSVAQLLHGDMTAGWLYQDGHGNPVESGYSRDTA